MKALAIIAAHREQILRASFNAYLATGVVIWAGLCIAMVTQ